MQKFIEADKWLFLFIQEHAHSSVLDVVMPPLREKFFWIPLYLLVLWFSYRQGRKFFVRHTAFLLGMVACTDILNRRLLKPLFQRTRPCNDLDIQTPFEALVPCGSGLSFPSSHALNHFAIAAFLYLTAHFVPVKWRFIWILWAATIGFAQIYVGVHYPADILGGALLGICFGNIVAKIYLCANQ